MALDIMTEGTLKKVLEKNSVAKCIFGSNRRSGSGSGYDRWLGKCIRNCSGWTGTEDFCCWGSVYL